MKNSLIKYVKTKLSMNQQLQKNIFFQFNFQSRNTKNMKKKKEIQTLFFSFPFLFFLSFLSFSFLPFGWLSSLSRMATPSLSLLLTKNLTLLFLCSKTRTNGWPPSLKLPNPLNLFLYLFYPPRDQPLSFFSWLFIAQAVEWAAGEKGCQQHGVGRE